MSAGRSIAREMSSSYPFQQGCRQLGRTGIRHVGPAVLLVCRMCLSIEFTLSKSSWMTVYSHSQLLAMPAFKVDSRVRGNMTLCNDVHVPSGHSLFQLSGVSVISISFYNLTIESRSELRIQEGIVISVCLSGPQRPVHPNSNAHVLNPTQEVPVFSISLVQLPASA